MIYNIDLFNLKKLLNSWADKRFVKVLSMQINIYL